MFVKGWNKSNHYQTLIRK